jgi:hypothetical protein
LPRQGALQRQVAQHGLCPLWICLPPKGDIRDGAIWTDPASGAGTGEAGVWLVTPSSAGQFPGFRSLSTRKICVRRHGVSLAREAAGRPHGKKTILECIPPSEEDGGCWLNAPRLVIPHRRKTKQVGYPAALLPTGHTEDGHGHGQLFWTIPRSRGGEPEG